MKMAMYNLIRNAFENNIIASNDKKWKEELLETVASHKGSE